jgi:Tfp pilus assembly protein PilF
MGRDQDAESEYRTAVALAPLSSSARNEFGKFLLERGRDAEAREQFAASAASDPNSEAQVHLGDFLAADGDPARARAAYTTAVTLDPFDSRARFGLARLDEAAGRLPEALNGYRAGLQTDPGNTQARAAVLRLTGGNAARPSVR